MESIRRLPSLLRATLRAYIQDRTAREAAALAYFALFALAPLLIVLIEIVALVASAHGAMQVRGAIVAGLASSIGQAGADGVGALVAATLQQAHHQGLAAGIIGWVVLVFAATGLLSAIQSSLDDIWQVTLAKRPWWSAFKDRLVATALIAGVAMVLLVSLAVNTGVAAATRAAAWNGPTFTFAISSLDAALSFAAVATVFAALYAFLPHAHVTWKEALSGATLAAALFVVGQFALSWYLGRAGTSSAFGAAGSLVVLVLWFYYSGQMFLIGAEFSFAYALDARSRSNNARLRSTPHL